VNAHRDKIIIGKAQALRPAEVYTCDNT